MTPLAQSEPEDATLIATRRHRLVDLLLVLAVSLSFSVSSSIYVVATGLRFPESSSIVTIQLVDGILRHLICVGLLAVLLLRQGRSLTDIGFRLGWKDIGRTIAVFVVSYLAQWGFLWVLWFAFRFLHLRAIGPQNVEFLAYARHGWLLPLAISYVIINPFFEELIVRAYLITEVRFLTGRTWVAVLASVALQVSYHLYQGLYPALSYIALFLAFSLYYVWTRRITPVIFAHMIDDIAALLLVRA